MSYIKKKPSTEEYLLYFSSIVFLHLYCEHCTFATVVCFSFLIPPLDCPDVSFPASIYVAAWSFFKHIARQIDSLLHCDR